MVVLTVGDAGNIIPLTKHKVLIIMYFMTNDESQELNRTEESTRFYYVYLLKQKTTGIR